MKFDEVYTYWSNNRWSSVLIRLPQVDGEKFPCWFISSKANGEWGTTWIPCTPSKALLGFLVLWGFIMFNGRSQQNCWHKVEDVNILHVFCTIKRALLYTNMYMCPIRTQNRVLYSHKPTKTKKLKLWREKCLLLIKWIEPNSTTKVPCRGNHSRHIWSTFVLYPINIGQFTHFTLRTRHLKNEVYWTRYL